MPRFDSPSVFASLLSPENGGFFTIEPIGNYTIEQRYLKNTNVLQTTYTSSHCTFRCIDFMPRFAVDLESHYHLPCEIYRLVEVDYGTPEVVVRFNPQLNYARGHTRIAEHDAWTLMAMNGEHQVFLSSNLSSQSMLGRCPISLTNGSYFVLSFGQPSPYPTEGKVRDFLNRTTIYWRRWVKHCHLPKVFQPEIIRSALTLRLLFYQGSGAILAAATTSLPEIIGEARNWDYRFCWLRDSYFVIQALLKLSQFEETEAFIGYLKGVVKRSHGYIRPLYTLDGHVVPEEILLDHLSGYKNSQPVRVGNNATTHLQDDVYGEMLLALHPLLTDERVVRPDVDELFGIVIYLVDIACQRFTQEDNGIWEFRNFPAHYTFSKMLCWAALDRATDIAERLGLKPYARHWATIRNAMKEELLARAWNPDVQAFTQSYGSEHLDASTLLMPELGLIEATDPRMKSTILVSEERLMKNGLAFRYTNVDDFGQPKNAFLICTFWMIDALIRLGQVDKATRYYKHVLKFGNHLDLFSEDIDPDTAELTGNFPQAYTHVAIINTAMLLSQQLPTSVR